MAVFSIRKAGGAITPDTGTVAYLSMIPATNRALRVVEASSSGLGTATAANEFQLCPAPAGTTPGGAVTPAPWDPISSAAAAFTTATTYATAPSRNAVAGIAYGVNANGGTYRWLAKTNFELKAQQAVAAFATMAWAVISGTSSIAGHIIVEEL
jgi:hypothetical protein